MSNTQREMSRGRGTGRRARLALALASILAISGALAMPALGVQVPTAAGPVELDGDHLYWTSGRKLIRHDFSSGVSRVVFVAPRGHEVFDLFAHRNRVVFDTYRSTKRWEKSAVYRYDAATGKVRRVAGGLLRFGRRTYICGTYVQALDAAYDEALWHVYRINSHWPQCGNRAPRNTYTVYMQSTGRPQPMMKRTWRWRGDAFNVPGVGHVDNGTIRNDTLLLGGERGFAVDAVSQRPFPIAIARRDDVVVVRNPTEFPPAQPGVIFQQPPLALVYRPNKGMVSAKAIVMKRMRAGNNDTRVSFDLFADPDVIGADYCGWRMMALAYNDTIGWEFRRFAPMRYLWDDMDTYTGPGPVVEARTPLPVGKDDGFFWTCDATNIAWAKVDRRRRTAEVNLLPLP